MHCPFPTSVRTSLSFPNASPFSRGQAYRESTAHQHTPGFPLKTCGNDMCKMCLPNVYFFTILLCLLFTRKYCLSVCNTLPFIFCCFNIFQNQEKDQYYGFKLWHRWTTERWEIHHL